MSTCVTDPITGVTTCQNPPPQDTWQASSKATQTQANTLDTWHTWDTWTSAIPTWTGMPIASGTGEGGSVSSQTNIMSSSNIAGTFSPTTSPSAVPSANVPENSNQSASSPSATVTPITASSGGIAPGAVAGIAIGTAILGAAIALITAIFILKRRRKNQQAYEDSQLPTPELIASLKGGGGNMSYVSLSQSIATPPVVASAFSQPAKTKLNINLASLAHSSNFLGDVLPAPAVEATVRNRCATLFNQILHHVESYYRDVHANMTPSMENDLSRFGSDSLDMVKMLRDTSMPTIAIKHALSGFITSIVSPEGEEQATLFPSEITGVKTERLTSTYEEHAAYIIYKRLAVHLYSPNAATIASQQSDIREAAEHFALTFFPWANPAFQDQEKDEDLVGIIASALEISIWLHSQPYTYKFIWEDPGIRGIVIAPGVMRTTDVSGKRIEIPQVLLEPLIVASR